LQAVFKKLAYTVKRKNAKAPVETSLTSAFLMLFMFFFMHLQSLHAQTLSQGEQVMKALAAAYPDRVGRAVLRNGDWAVQVYGVWFYYAGGRLLPEELRMRSAEYDPQTFYRYPRDLPEWKAPDTEATAQFRSMQQRRSSRTTKRSQHFFDALWRASNKDEAYRHVKTIRFLGWNVLVHYSILEELALIEEAINNEAKVNTQVRQWLNAITSLSAWNWRNIADVQSRSFHSYGAAIDIQVKALRGEETYWLWTSQKGVDWWAVPYQSRLHPPDVVVKIFESYGFIWGGKWLFYDTMHFEYRPEAFILNNIPMNGIR
jgi:pimeloyl-ACP methyl ester carboxylesterase